MMDRIIGRLESLLRFTMNRHKVLTSNLANSDTPGYKARDLKFDSVFDKEVLRLKNTSPLHLRATEISSNGVLRQREGTPWLDGNDVEEEVEVAKITENALLYQAAARLLSERFKMYRTLFTGR